MDYTSDTFISEWTTHDGSAQRILRRTCTWTVTVTRGRRRWSQTADVVKDVICYRDPCGRVICEEEL